MRADRAHLRSNRTRHPSRPVSPHGSARQTKREERRIIEDWTNETPPVLSAPNLHPRIDSPTPFVAGYARASENGNAVVAKGEEAR
ncbi:unnamed protein product [Lasius platythorax]|uniref:Uncharacterized protein n=1 Tax=Lasius platythorax TaxID=488582 RepID=A0AAV2N740_9HYME